jgi:hypothetical protein
VIGVLISVTRGQNFSIFFLLILIYGLLYLIHVRNMAPTDLTYPLLLILSRQLLYQSDRKDIFLDDSFPTFNISVLLLIDSQRTDC